MLLFLLIYLIFQVCKSLFLKFSSWKYKETCSGWLAEKAQPRHHLLKFYRPWKKMYVIFYASFCCHVKLVGNSSATICSIVFGGSVEFSFVKIASVSRYSIASGILMNSVSSPNSLTFCSI